MAHGANNACGICRSIQKAARQSIHCLNCKHLLFKRVNWAFQTGRQTANALHPEDLTLHCMWVNP